MDNTNNDLNVLENASKNKRFRRTKIAIERDVDKAITQLLSEVGFANLTIMGITERANIEPSVLYRRFSNLEEIINHYTHNYDYWFSNIADAMPKDLSHKETFRWIMINLARALFKNKAMQKLLTWELSEDNESTRRTARLREIMNEPLIRMLEMIFKDSNVDINAICAHTISGIYYSILHSERSTFCAVDFTGKKGLQRLEDALNTITDLIFSLLEKENEKQKLIEKLRAEGVSEDIINKCLA